MQSLPHKKVPSFVPHSCHCCETLRRVDGPCHYVGDSVVTPACRQRGSCSAHRGTVVEGAQRSHSLQLIASGAWSTPLGSAKGEPAQDGRSSRPTSGRSWLCFLLCKEDRALSVVTGTHRHYHGTFGGAKEQLHSHAVLFLHYAIQALWPGVHFFSVMKNAMPQWMRLLGRAATLNSTSGWSKLLKGPAAVGLKWFRVQLERGACPALTEGRPSRPAGLVTGARRLTSVLDEDSVELGQPALAARVAAV